ncbi:protein CMSS1 isoform X2 [Dioscorea cayenensis subsp. rotundata]|uniref:Protein CMSS1 isoform X2 n=1 Tax=Dioscorea cayennensis subsp. rotundata TaxID=55577 RepID=A0AB40C2X7_DIOCR|nr:protein CMSS1 isoform X2 [Dioscorea cayenensis subsp. rotundata]
MAGKLHKSPKPKRPSSLHATNKKKVKKRNFANPNLIPLGKNPIVADFENKANEELRNKKKKGKEAEHDALLLSTLPAAQQLRFFLDSYQSANGIKLSPLELEAFKDTSVAELPQEVAQDVDNFSDHIKTAFDDSWREALCEGKLSDGIDAGSPAVLVISASALRSLELLRGLKKFTKECRPAKLFAKHMKVEDQVSILKGRVNIASGTPSRIKKLIDMDAMILSRLTLVVLDMHRDAKGYTLLTLKQIRDEFWDLYKSHFHPRLLQGDTRFCFYGSRSGAETEKARTTAAIETILRRSPATSTNPKTF